MKKFSKAHLGKLHDHAHLGRLHDHAHLGRLHDHAHLGRLHDHAHLGRLHDHAHLGRLHDHAHLGRLHDHAHVLGGELHSSADIIKGALHINSYEDHTQNKKSASSVYHSIQVSIDSAGYFNSGFAGKVQWGYLKVKEPGVGDYDDTILFVNDTRFVTGAGEEDRKVYFDLKKVPVSVSGSIMVEIELAHNFGYMPHAPLRPRKHRWERDAISWYTSDDYD